MKLTPMRFKDYVWPHNPRVYEISFERRIAVSPVPFGRFVMRSMGMSPRVLRGEGEFTGPGAYDEFKKLASVFYDETPGILVHPVWQSSRAYFASLSVRQEPREDYVSYAFEFWEGYDGYVGTLRSSPEPVAAPAKAEQWHTVVYGDTLWAISRKYSLSLSELMALNPQIRNPNVIYAGDRIRVKGGAA